MIKTIFFEDIKSSYVQIMERLSSEIEGELFIKDKKDLDDLFYKDIIKLSDAAKLLKCAKAANDEITVQAALVYIRAYAMRLSGFFEDFKDDADILLKASSWPDMPENYQVPEHYNYSHK